MSRPTTYENTFRVFDQAVMDWLGGLTVDYGRLNQELTPEESQTGATTAGLAIPEKRILRVMAAPERAFAEVQQLLIDRGWMEESLISDDFRNVPLPIASIYRMGPIPRLSQMASPHRYKRLFANKDGKWMGSDHPTPIDIPYDLNFWCLKQYTIIHIMDWIASHYGRRGAAPSEFYLTVDHDKYPHAYCDYGIPVFGRKIHSVRIEAMTDVSDVESELIDYRYMRLSVLMTVRAWLMHPITESGDVVVLVDEQDELVASGVDLHTSLIPPSGDVIGHVFSIDNMLNFYGSDRFLDPSVGVNVWYEQSSEPKPFERRFAISFPDQGGDAATQRLNPIPLYRPPSGDPCSFGARFEYKTSTAEPVRFYFQSVEWVGEPDPFVPEITNYHPVYTDTQVHELTALPDRWCRVEFFGVERNHVGFRWECSQTQVVEFRKAVFAVREHRRGSDEFVTDADMQLPDVSAWMPNGFATLEKLPAEDGMLFMRATGVYVGDGFEQSITVPEGLPYVLLRVELLQVIERWRIILDNDDVAPTWSAEITVEQNWRNACLVSVPIPSGSSMKIRFEALDENAALDIGEVTLRRFDAPIFGTKVPI